MMEKIWKKLGFEESCVVDKVRKSCGMAGFWYKEDVVKMVVTTDLIIEIQIENKDDKVLWWLIRVYASTNSKIRRKQWKVLGRRKVL